jgi:hypothetical protein
VSEFWVPRGYAHIIVDVRGCNDSEGNYDLFGAQEQQDLYNIIEWVAEQPWCSGNVGMSGISYMGRTQLFAAEQQPPHLKAIFPYDASCDFYRDACFHGGIATNFLTHWTSFVMNLNMTSGRNPKVDKLKRMLEIMYSHEYPFDGPFYQERSTWPRLSKVKIPAYFGSGWNMTELHLRGVFEGYNGTGASSISADRSPGFWARCPNPPAPSRRACSNPMPPPVKPIWVSRGLFIAANR